MRAKIMSSSVAASALLRFTEDKELGTLLARILELSLQGKAALRASVLGDREEGAVAAWQRGQGGRPRPHCAPYPVGC